MRMIFRILQIIILMLFWGTESLPQENKDKNFADFLFDNGEYYRAITEYYRLMHNSSNQDQKISYLSNIGNCYLLGEDYEGYISFYNNNRHYFLNNQKTYSLMKFNLGKSYYYLQFYNQAIAMLESTSLEDKQLADENYMFLGLSFARLQNWESALNSFENINYDKKYLFIKDSIKNDFPGLINDSEKSPALAGIFSGLLPGAGYIYCDRLGTGLTSLVVNGLIAWAFIDALENEQYGLTSTIGFFGIGWYVGNILGSINAANEYNVKRYSDYFDSIQNALE